MTDINLNKEEKQRLKKINASLGSNFLDSITNHFNSVGKIGALNGAFSAEEKKKQVDQSMNLFRKQEFDLSIAITTDFFLSVARRVESDAELAALLPKNKFDAKDVELLEKLQAKSLATLIKLQL